MRAINLLPKDESAARRPVPIPIVAACVGFVVASAFLAFTYISASDKVQSDRTALRTAQAQYAAVPAPIAPPPIDAQLPVEQQARVTAISTALSQRVDWDRVLREISQVVPSDVWLLTLNASSPTATTPAEEAIGTKPSGIVLTGCTYSQDSVARFLARLSIVPDLSSVTLGSSTAGSAAGGGAGCPPGMVGFTLNGDIRLATAS